MIANTEEEVFKKSLLHLLQLAQQAADVRHLPVALCKSKDGMICGGAWKDGQVLFVSLEKDGIIKSRKQVLASVYSNLGQGSLHFRNYPHYRDFLLFLPSSRQQSDNGSFWYCAHDAELPSWAIFMNRVGRSRVVLPNKAGVIKDSEGKRLDC